MKLSIFCILLGTLAWLGCSSPIERRRYLVGYPKIFRRSPQKLGVMYVKGQVSGGRVYNPTPPPQLRKGQYVCGGKVCALRPGEQPRGCDGMCQYAVP